MGGEEEEGGELESRRRYQVLMLGLSGKSQIYSSLLISGLYSITVTLE